MRIGAYICSTGDFLIDTNSLFSGLCLRWTGASSRSRSDSSSSYSALMGGKESKDASAVIGKRIYIYDDSCTLQFCYVCV